MVFDKFKPDAVIHFAGLKAVGESVASLLDYDVNVGGTATLLGAAERSGCLNVVYSSSMMFMVSLNIYHVTKIIC